MDEYALNHTSSATKLHTAKCSHTWTLHDYEEIIKAKNKRIVRSKKFHLEVDQAEGERATLTFQLKAEVAADGNEESDEDSDEDDFVPDSYNEHYQQDDINIYVRCRNDLVKAADFMCELFLLNSKGERLMERKLGIHALEDDITSHPMVFSKREIAHNGTDLLVDGCLRIGCLIEVQCDCPQGPSRALKSMDDVLSKDEDTLHACFGELFECGDLSDIKLICEGTEFQCHKLVLAARSDVFRAMFSNKDTIEAINNTVNIEDSTPDSVRQMLKFLYTDKCDKLEDHAMGLLPLADKYNLPRLKLKCERWMAGNIQEVNAAEILFLANMHGSTHLTTIALNYVALHMDSVKHTMGWERLKKECPDVMVKLVETMSEPKFPHSAKKIADLEFVASCQKARSAKKNKIGSLAKIFSNNLQSLQRNLK